MVQNQVKCYLFYILWYYIIINTAFKVHHCRYRKMGPLNKCRTILFVPLKSALPIKVYRV